MQNICSETGCEAKATVRGMCNKHYRRSFKMGKFEPVFKLPIALRLSRGSLLNDDTGCIEWTGTKNRSGYGRIGVGSNTSLTTHRVAWEAAHGPIPKGMCVLHHCDNRLCIKIEHLFLGTFADNHKDMDSKGRRAVLRGQRNGYAKITDKEAKEIINDTRTLREIAEDYKLSFSHVGAIKRGEKWRHLTKSQSLELENV